MHGEPAGLPLRRHVYVPCGMLMAIYALRILDTGVRVGPDTFTYSAWADLLVTYDFNVGAYLRDQSFVVPPVLYISWIAIVAALKAMLGPWWMTGVVTLNWLSFGVGAYVTLAAIRRLTASWAALFLAALLFVVAFDLLNLIPFVLSDLMFWGLSTAVVATGAQLAYISETEHESKAAMRTVVTGSVLVLLAFTVRPAAMPLMVFWIAAIAARYARGFVDRFGTALLLAAAGAGAVITALHAYVLMHPAAWPFGTLPAMLSVLAQEYRQGVLVYAPDSSLIVEPAGSWLGFVRLTVQKVMFFLTPWLPHYSWTHTLMNLAFFVPAYGLAIAAVVYATRLTPPQRRATRVLAVFVMAVTLFHAMMQIDYDHRYRLPMLPALIMLAGLGLESQRRPQRLASTARAR